MPLMHEFSKKMGIQKYSLTELEKAFVFQQPEEWARLLSLKTEDATLCPYWQVQQSIEQTKDVLADLAIVGAKKNFIHSLILAGNCDLITFFLKNSDYIFDCCPPFGLTALHYAALGVSEEMIYLLHDHGFNILAQDHWGRTPLHYAILNPKVEIQNAILKTGGSWLQKDHFKASPLDFFNYQSQLKSPLYIDEQEVNLTLFLCLSMCLQVIMQSSSFSDYPIFAKLSRLLSPCAEFAVMTHNKSLSNQALARYFGLFLICQQLSLSKMALSSFVIGRKSLDILKNIPTTLKYYPVLPLQACVFSGIHLLQNTVLVASFLKQYPISLLEMYIGDWVAASQWSQTKIASLSSKEWTRLQDLGLNILQNVKSFFST